MCSQQKPKIDRFRNIDNNLSLIIGVSNCGRTYLMKYILLQKQEQVQCGSSEAASIYINTKSLNQCPNIEAQPSDEIQLLENYENSTVFDDMLVSKQASNIDLFFT